MTCRVPRSLRRLALAATVVSMLVFSSQAQIPMTGVPVPELEAIDTAVTEFMGAWKVPGMAVGIVRDGRLVFARGYGFANTETGELVQPTSLFRIASVSKPITATAILHLVEEGMLALDDAAFAILNDLEAPEGTLPDPRLQDITIEHLLTHTAGFSVDQLGLDPQFGLHETAAEALGEPRPASATTLIRYMMGEQLMSDPGSRYTYSNFGYNVLGRVIEHITGRDYESYVQDEILAPMGVRTMQIGHTKISERAPFEVSYYGSSGGGATSVFPDEGPVAWPDGRWYLEAMDSHGGWIASVVDMMRFVVHVDGHASPDDFLATETLDKMVRRPTLSVWERSSWWYGLGWSVNAEGTWWHAGSLDGTSSILVRTESGLSWFAVANYRPWMWGRFNSALDDMLWNCAGQIAAWPPHDLFDRY